MIRVDAAEVDALLRPIVTTTDRADGNTSRRPSAVTRWVAEGVRLLGTAPMRTLLADVRATRGVPLPEAAGQN